MEVRSAAQVVVLRGHPFGRRHRTLDQVAPIGQDVAHMAVLPGAQFERQQAGGLHALRPVAPGQAEQPEAAAVAMFGMAASVAAVA